MVGKIKQLFFNSILTLLLGSLFSEMGHKIHLYDNFTSVIFICFTAFFQGKFGRIDCIILMKEFASLKIVPLQIGKRHFFTDHSNVS